MYNNEEMMILWHQGMTELINYELCQNFESRLNIHFFFAKYLIKVQFKKYSMNFRFFECSQQKRNCENVSILGIPISSQPGEDAFSRGAPKRHAKLKSYARRGRG